ncbi:MAG TPA: DNA polymerase ligase N-terminal domain-containing protein [Candidatus Angelobacter sp.]|nr:DNA polymerase ligase N-terminal domain-containing protein [Candidatus Angelobacter sp.]
MALEKYNQKRRFDSTPEPAGKIVPSGKNRFVVQKHRASHLHYDFRLEMEGVLKSWAVPKGPSLDSADKRLAMQVEDHPVSYFDFEGVIPPGNYGAGTVMVWDVGIWEPLGDAHAMLSKGDLKFRLHGQKLNGEFVLAHMRSRRPGSKGTEWLLIKKKDEAMRPGFDIDALDYSVLTQRTLAQIGGDEKSAEWESNRRSPVRKGAEWLFADTAASAKKRSRGNAVASKKAAQPITKSKPESRRKTGQGATSSRRTYLKRRAS